MTIDHEDIFLTLSVEAAILIPDELYDSLLDYVQKYRTVEIELREANEHFVNNNLNYRSNNESENYITSSLSRHKNYLIRLNKLTSRGS